ncbi:MAG: AAA family ATPase [Planctomycetia bacterium]|nr:AAA family ATPase [Planctomycetia bacterium]
MSGPSATELAARLKQLGLQSKKPQDPQPGAPAAPAGGVATAVPPKPAARPPAAPPPKAPPAQSPGAVANGGGSAGDGGDKRLDKLLRRISDLTGDPSLVKGPEGPPPPVATPVKPPEPRPPRPEGPFPTTPPTPKRDLSPGPDAKPTLSAGIAIPPAPPEPFVPAEPVSFQEAGLTEGQVESLLLKYLLSVGTATGRDTSNHVKLPFKLVDDLLAVMKNDQLVVYYADAPMNDYVYQLTDMGRERARRHLEHSTYFGAAPVTLSDYIKSVKCQSLTNQHPAESDLERAFNDLLINQKMLRRIGPAINSGRGLFLYGSAGNGKTSIAERITSAFGSLIWIPRSISIDGEIMRVFDPSNHEEVPLEGGDGLLESNHIDKRWIRIRRPTIVSGGELTMDNLEVTLNRATGVYEAPLQLKSNCGTLVIDDFGRQKMSIDQLLNRWILPLEKRYDFLNLSSGKKIQVPFDQLIIFSTNLEPRDLVDEAFLRRIPYKICIEDPSEEEFRDLFRMMAGRFGIEYRDDVVDYVIENHYRRVNRPFRCCQPRDLLLQIRNYCHFMNLVPEMTRENFDMAVENYFAIM